MASIDKNVPLSLPSSIWHKSNEFNVIDTISNKIIICSYFSLYVLLHIYNYITSYTLPIQKTAFKINITLYNSYMSL